MFRDGKLAMSLACCCAEPVIGCDCDDFGVRRVTLKYFQETDGQTKFETFPMFLEDNKWTTGIVGVAPICPDGPTQITDFTKVDIECVEIEGRIEPRVTLWNYSNSDVDPTSISVPFPCPLVNGVIGEQICSSLDGYFNGVCRFQVCVHEFLGPE